MQGMLFAKICSKIESMSSCLWHKLSINFMSAQLWSFLLCYSLSSTVTYRKGKTNWRYDEGRWSGYYKCVLHLRQFSYGNRRNASKHDLTAIKSYCFFLLLLFFPKEPSCIFQNYKAVPLKFRGCNVMYFLFFKSLKYKSGKRHLPKPSRANIQLNECWLLYITHPQLSLSTGFPLWSTEWKRCFHSTIYLILKHICNSSQITHTRPISFHWL